MKTHYFFEEEKYSYETIKSLFGEDHFNHLLERKICTPVSRGNLIKFEFVGVLEHGESLYLIAPKYLKKQTTMNEIINKMQLILKVLRKYNVHSNTTIENESFLNYADKSDSFSILSLAEFILNDYIIHNYYSALEKKIKIDGNGDILWNKTIEELTPVFSKNTPFYLNTYNLESQANELNIIIKIHKWAVHYCFKRYGKWVGYEDANIETDFIDLENIGSPEYIISVIDKELNKVYVDQKILLLKALKSLMELKGTFDNDHLNIYGVTHFEIVWESICSKIFSNERETYKSKMPSPVWHSYKYNETYEKDTFIPDIIKTYNDGSDDYFLVLDAKYYNIQFKDQKKLTGNPSLEDVSKQLLYMKALEREWRDKINRNYFLFPREGKLNELFSLFGKVEFSFISKDPVYLVYLSDEKVYNMYLGNLTISLENYKDLESKIKTI